MNANEVLAPQVAAALDEVKCAGVLIPCPEEIADYLLRYPDTASWLVGLARAAREQLPQDAQLSLELYRERESDDTSLTLYVRQIHYASDLLNLTHAIMAQFDHEIETCSGLVLLTTDFRPPR